MRLGVGDVPEETDFRCVALSGKNATVPEKAQSPVARPLSEALECAIQNVLAGLEASECRYSGAKSAPFGHARVCPTIEKDLK